MFVCLFVDGRNCLWISVREAVEQIASAIVDSSGTAEKEANFYRYRRPAPPIFQTFGGANQESENPDLL